MRDYYPSFDILRLLLAIQVVAIHTAAMPNVFINPVPAFLAVSGFVVMGSIERHPYRIFFLNRALRVLPLLFSIFIAVWIMLGRQEMLHTIQYWLYPIGDAPTNGAVWSLIYEEFYYALLALLFLIGTYRRKFAVVIIALCCMVFMALGPAIGLPRPMLLFLGGAFFLGNVAYLYREKIRRINPWLSSAFLLAMIIVNYRLPYTHVVEPAHALSDYLSFAALLVFAISGPQLPKLPFDLSYSLYLIHLMVRAELLGFIPIGPRMFWFTLLASLPICFCSWHLIEKPALSLRGKKSRIAKQTSAAAA